MKLVLLRQNGVANKRARELLENGCDAFEEGAVAKAVEYFKKAAKLGSGEAQVNLANIYSDGAKGIAKNNDLAVHWYELAVRKGMPEAAYNLAIHYLKENEELKYKKWMFRAAEMGDLDAREVIGKEDKGADS